MIVAFLSIQAIYSMEQNCVFNQGYFEVWARTVSLYYCEIFDTKLSNEYEAVKTLTYENEKSDSDVLAVLYGPGNTLDFIPCSLYVKFPNLKLLRVHACGLKEIESQYFRNARNLKSIEIENNMINHLEAYIFVGAPNVESINLFNNGIESVHSKTFGGLNKLASLELSYNNIMQMGPTTFSQLSNLSILRLDANECINRYFTYFFGRFDEIEAAIQEHCK